MVAVTVIAAIATARTPCSAAGASNTAFVAQGNRAKDFGASMVLFRSLGAHHYVNAPTMHYVYLDFGGSNASARPVARLPPGVEQRLHVERGRNVSDRCRVHMLDS